MAEPYLFCLPLSMACILFLSSLWLCSVCCVANDYVYLTDPEEAEAAYDILEAINSAVPWRLLHPDNLCLYGPHGLNCDADENNVLHIVELSLGWVAENDNNPQCGSNATISSSLQKLPYLRKLLFYNCFTQKELTIPPVIWSLSPSLEHLVFMHNAALVGEIPREMARLQNLERLVLVENGLSGSIPAEIGSLMQLNQLVLTRNRLTGVIPDAFGNLRSLKVLDLNGNVLQGNVSPLLGRLSNLEKLDLSSNALTGNIPVEIGELVSLQLLDLSHNNLSGDLPSSIGSLSQLRILQLSNNKFTGDIPHDIWANLSLLVGLGLSNAGLGGRIPPTLGNLPHLNYLDLSGNRLQGTVPFTLGHLQHVYQINLSDNALVGILPFSADFISKLGRNLRLNGNVGLCLSSEWVLPSKAGVGEGMEICSNEYYWSLNTVQKQLETSSVAVKNVNVSGSPLALGEWTTMGVVLAMLLFQLP